MDFGTALQLLNPDERTTVRQIKNTIFKENNAKIAVDFNQTCILNGLLPKFTLCHKASSKRVTAKDRLAYLKGELENKRQLLDTLSKELILLRRRWSEVSAPENVRIAINTALERLAENHLSEGKRRTGRKLSALYGGPLKIPTNIDQFINLSKYTLTEKQREFLNLGLNCHTMSKRKHLSKRIELEILLNDIQRLEKENKLATSPDLQAEIIREANITRGHTRSPLLTPELKAAATELRNNDSIVIRRADKSSVFVILDKEDYMNKISTILSDDTKFKIITRNPTQDIKTKLNRIIRRSNNINEIKLPLIEGDHKLGYAYGNVKTHKSGHPLRPIISQTPAVTYKLAKRLNEILTPFTPAFFSLKSTEEFLDILKSTRPSNIMASMDVESLFTNVPVDETIELICQRIYHAEERKITIPEESLRTLLQACTKEAPFYGPDGKMYVQRDGVAMGSPLGVLFANFYMGSVEEKVLTQHPQHKPIIYARYIDDIFISAENEAQVLDLINEFKKQSCLNYTHELEEDRKLPFLDVMVRRGDSSFSTSVYVKSTNLGFCLNGNSDCPERYRRSVINAFVKRALTHSSTWEATNAELTRVSQLLANNGYPQNEIDDVIRRRMDKFMTGSPTSQETPSIKLFYKNTMSSAYKDDERALKSIIYKNVRPVEENTTLDIIIYYKSRKTAALVMKNSCLPTVNPLQEVNVLYQHKCSIGDCSRLTSRYIGFTTTTLSKRITAHLQDGAIRRHYMSEHGLILKRHHMEDNTSILERENDIKRLKMTEAVYIYSEKPSINIQQQPELSLPTKRQASRNGQTAH